MNLETYLRDIDFIIYLKTNSGLAESYPSQMEKTQKRVKANAPSDIRLIYENLHEFADLSDVVHIKVEPAKLPKESPEVVQLPPGDIYGTSAHHAAATFIQFHCIRSDFWEYFSIRKNQDETQYQELPPIFDIDLLAFQIQSERLRRFRNRVYEVDETESPESYTFPEVLDKLGIARTTLLGYISEMDGIEGGMRVVYDIPTLQHILVHIVAHNRPNDHLRGKAQDLLDSIR